jgi:hypothetical protein
MSRTVHINRDRFWTSQMELKEIGAYDDEATGLGADAGIATLRDIEVANVILRLADPP